MATTTNIQITACDNELYILASQEPVPSIEICHLKSGYSKPVSYAIAPQAILKPGNYSLTMVGINWGGPAAFKVFLAGPNQTYELALSPQPIGVVWHQTVTITV